MSGKVAAYLPITLLAEAIIKGNLVVASVNPEVVRGDQKPASTNKGGHLVLVTGVRISKGKPEGFIINNPSGTTAATQRNAFTTLDTFRSAYGSQGIILKARGLKSTQ